MSGDLEFYFVVSAITVSSLISGSSTLTLPNTNQEIGASQDQQLFTPKIPFNDSNYIVHPFECEVNGLSKDEIDRILAGSSHSMAVTVIDGSNNDTYTVEENKGEQVYDLELKTVSNTLYVKGNALLNNSDGNMNGSSLNGTKCEVVFHISEGNENDTTESESVLSRSPIYRVSSRWPRILSTYNHVVLMKGAPEQVISCTGKGNPQPQIRWFSYNPNANAKVLLEKNPSHNQATSYLIFSEVTNETSGNYTCLAENIYGRVQKTFEVEVISVKAINPHCNDIDESPPSPNEIFESESRHQEILRRAKRHLWYQWRGQKIYIPPFSRPFDPPTKGHSDTDLQKMLNYMAERLLLADKVAVNKWDNGTPVEDLPREQIILENMVKEARNRGLNPNWASLYFRDQIEANKDIQYALINTWELQGTRPPGPPVDLGNEIRPKIDEINKKLMELAKTTELQRKEWQCSVEVEKNARFATFLYNLDPLHQKALQRASENLCIRRPPSPPHQQSLIPTFPIHFHPPPPLGPPF